MQPLSRDFLTQIAREYDLSEEQREVFVELFSSKRSQREIADNLHISHNALRTRMTWVYQKFSFGGRVPNKSRKLHDFLFNKYQESQPKSIPNVSANETDIDALVAEVRKKVSFDTKQRCGTMQVLDMTQPVGLGDVYTDVNILEKITARSRKGIAELNEIVTWDVEECHRFGLGRQEKRISGLEAVAKYPKLMVWGKPGAGKTTFLKYLAMQCIEGKFQENLVPIFITLKDFTENLEKINLFDYIEKLFKERRIEQQKTKQLLEKGKFLILLDGLDEVNAQYSRQVIQGIQSFADKYPLNHFAITCRIAAKEYTFQGFTEVEVADFDDQQIKSFAKRWFRKNSVKAEKFITKLKDSEPIQELAINPLLLTLLCLVFGEEENFPPNRGELYEEGIDVLLKKWDAKRNIERDQVYKKLSLKRKKNLLINIAFTTFNNQDYFFKQRTVEKCIADYISKLPDAKTDPEALLVDSNAVLKSIEAQHGLLVERAKGIYSFSHLTFQEYFTARKIAESPGIRSLQNLAKHITENRWREVFLLATLIMEDASILLALMKQEIDNIVANNYKIQDFLGWVVKMSNSFEMKYKVEKTYKLAIRASVIALSPSLDLSYSISFSISKSIALNYFFKLCESPYLAQETKIALNNLKNKLPDRRQEKKFFIWWKTNGQVWIEALRPLIFEEHTVYQDWQFSIEQKELIQQYYDSIKVFMYCLNSDCYINREVRQEIENTLLLPMAEIEKIKPNYLNL